LRLNYSELPSSFGFKFNLRRYTTAYAFSLFNNAMILCSGMQVYFGPNGKVRPAGFNPSSPLTPPP
jgi:hypothetical protein